MPGKKCSKALQGRCTNIGQFAKDKSSNKLEELQLTFEENTQKIVSLNNQVREQLVTISALNETISSQNANISSLTEQMNAKNEEVELLNATISDAANSVKIQIQIQIYFDHNSYTMKLKCITLQL